MDFIDVFTQKDWLPNVPMNLVSGQLLLYTAHVTLKFLVLLNFLLSSSRPSSYIRVLNTLHCNTNLPRLSRRN